MARRQRTQTRNGENEVILLMGNWIPLDMDITICDTNLTMRKLVNYFGIRLVPRPTFWTQIWHAATKAAKVTTLFSRLLGNLGSPKQSRPSFITAITDSIMLCDNEVWVNALKFLRRIRILSSVQRTNLNERSIMDVWQSRILLRNTDAKMASRTPLESTITIVTES